jgi:hypothetical protein
MILKCKLSPAAIHRQQRTLYDECYEYLSCLELFSIALFGFYNVCNFYCYDILYYALCFGPPYYLSNVYQVILSISFV